MTPERNRPAYNPGGMQCEHCDELFIGEEWHALCGACAKRLVDALQVAQVGFEQIETMPTVTDAEIKRVALAKINAALVPSERETP